jgi:hypothetical protein
LVYKLTLWLLRLLLLPSFFIRTRSVDLRRLFAIGASPSVSGQVAKIKKVIFQNTAWDPTYFRRIVCSRHEQVGEYLEKDFVPTLAESIALEELEEIHGQMTTDTNDDNTLVLALQTLKCSVEAVEIQTRNPFRNPILRKVWDEYAMEAYRRVQWEQDLLSLVLPATQKAGMSIRHFSHDQLLSSHLSVDTFASANYLKGTPLVGYGDSLRSLKLVISDHDGIFSTHEEIYKARLRKLLESFPALEHLSLRIEMLGSLGIDFFPTSSTATLRSLALSSISVNPATLIAVLESHMATLKRLRLHYADIPHGQGSWKALLEEMRDLIGDRLEKFQLCGFVRSEDENEQWLLQPIYDEEWDVLKWENSPRALRTKELEDFLLRRGPWPMFATDTFEPSLRDL